MKTAPIRTTMTKRGPGKTMKRLPLVRNTVAKGFKRSLPTMLKATGRSVDRLRLGYYLGFNEALAMVDTLAHKPARMVAQFHEGATDECVRFLRKQHLSTSIPLSKRKA